MGIFSKKQPEPITFADMIVELGYPAGTILREQDDLWQMSCGKTSLSTVGKADCYRATLVNEKGGVSVKVNGKVVSRLTDYSLPDAVKALRSHGGTYAPAFIVLRDEGRKTDAIYVRAK